MIVTPHPCDGPDEPTGGLNNPADGTALLTTDMATCRGDDHVVGGVIAPKNNPAMVDTQKQRSTNYAGNDRQGRRQGQQQGQWRVQEKISPNNRGGGGGDNQNNRGSDDQWRGM